MPPPPRKIASKIIGGPARYRAGKPTAVEASSSSEDEDEDEDEEAQTEVHPPPKPTTTKPAASSFPRTVPKPAAPAIKEEDFETEESEDGSDKVVGGERSDEGSDDSESEEDEDSDDEDESSSDDDTARRKLLRPIFVKKGQRAEQSNGVASAPERSEEEVYAEEEARRKERANELVQEQLEKRAAARAAGKKEWDDSEPEDGADVDDRDGLDPEAEEAAWKLREIKRVKRDREALIAAEKEREEIERRRNLTAEEREAEDREFLDAQKEARDGKGKMEYLQKYYHKGAFYQDDAKAAGLAQRDIMGASFQDQVDRSVLPEYLQIRDMTRVGKKGRTRYKDLKSEDTGRWGDLDDRPRRRDGDYSGNRDERFMSDRDRDRMAERTGANASELGERKRPADGDSRDNKRVRAS